MQLNCKMHEQLVKLHPIELRLNGPNGCHWVFWKSLLLMRQRSLWTSQTPTNQMFYLFLMLTLMHSFKHSIYEWDAIIYWMAPQIYESIGEDATNVFSGVEYVLTDAVTIRIIAFIFRYRLLTAVTCTFAVCRRLSFIISSRVALTNVFVLYSLFTMLCSAIWH